ncbi:MAG: prepilin-type N-terminal cleavage/methylation domain-containing protein [Planctomycetota bacterium]|jgi:prepilin-type N-terminal cleavage/methylation domain-containing protein
MKKMRRIEPNIQVPLSPWRRRAFTLTELLVVVAIIAVAGGASIGLYAGSSERLKLEKTARNFLITAKYARIMAIEKQREYKIKLDSSNGGFALTTIEWNESTEEFEQKEVKDYYCKPVLFEGNIRFEDIKVAENSQAEQTDDEEAEATIVFRPDGSSDTVVVQIGNGKTHYTISISAATGKAKIHFGELENAEIGTIDLDAES